MATQLQGRLVQAYAKVGALQLDAGPLKAKRENPLTENVDPPGSKVKHVVGNKPFKI